ncbi:hypothetical protein [Streptomyces sp. NPDC055140]
METSVLKYPRISEVVDSLVAAGGGRVTYDTGCGGREMLIAASARLAVETNTPLTIVEGRILHSEVRAFVSELQPDIRCAVISAEEAAWQPAGSITGVLAVHADVLRYADVREPLLAMARSADHLVVARHDYSDTTLDSLAAPGLELRYGDLMPTVPQNSGPRYAPTVPQNSSPRPEVFERRETALRSGAIPEDAPADRRWISPSGEARMHRVTRQLDQASEQDGPERSDPDEVSRRAEQVRAQQRQRAADYPAPPESDPGRPAPQAHEQAVVHQQNRPQGPGLS